MRSGSMSGGVGVLKVTVLKGKRLAIRDFKSSDPYVVVRVGDMVYYFINASFRTQSWTVVRTTLRRCELNIEPIIRLTCKWFTRSNLRSNRWQTAKTKVINSCLNPIWNEELTFIVKEPPGELKLEVFDWDRFKYDDKMGIANVSIQPIISASKLKRALQLTAGETKLRKVAANADNCLMEDSFVTHIDGEILQHIHLRLNDVESGELFLTIKWIDRATGTSSTTDLVR